MDLSAYDEPQPLRRLLQDLLSEEKLKRFLILQDAFLAVERGNLPPDALATAEDEHEDLLQEIRQRAMDLLAAGTLIVRGWLEGAQDREPTEMPFSVLAKGYIDVPVDHFVVDGNHYIGCTVSRLNRSGRSVVPSAPGRPLSPKMRAALDEALPRVHAGEKKDVVALEVAQKHGVNKETLRTYLKPSRAPKSIKP